MKQAVLVRGARQLLTLRGDRLARRGDAMRQLGVIPDGALLIANGKILEVGPARRVENLAAARDALEISADGKVVMPGFVDAHAEPACGPARLDAYENGFRRNGTPPAKPSNASFSTRRMEMEARSALRHFLRNGTTTLAARSGSRQKSAVTLKALRAYHRLPEPSLTLAPVLCWPEELGSADAMELFTSVRRRHLSDRLEVTFPRSNPEATGDLLGCARQMGFRTALSLSSEGRGGPEMAIAAAVDSVDCRDELPKADADRLAAADIVVTLLPGAAFHHRQGRYPPGRSLIDAGAAVAIATGYDSELSPTCSMPAVLSLACAEMGITPAEAVTAATINAAHTLGLADHVGSLEVGKDADLVLFHAADYREIPCHFGMNLVAMVIKRGEVIYPRMVGP